MHHRQNYRPEPLRSDSRRQRVLLRLALGCAVLAAWAFVVFFVGPSKAAISSQVPDLGCPQTASALPILGMVSY